MVAIWHKIKIGLAIGVAVVACPCHLALTIPILLAVTAGTSVGAVIANSPLIFFLVSTALFGGGLFLAFRWLGSSGKKAVCNTTTLSSKKGKGKISIHANNPRALEKKPIVLENIINIGENYEIKKN